MSFLSFAKKEEEISLLIDIGSGTVSVAVVSFKKKVPHFLYYLKDSFPIDEKLDSAKFLKKLEQILGNLISKAVHSNKQKIKSVGVSFSSPWYTFKSKGIHLSEDKDFVITKSFLDSVIKREQDLYEKELNDEGRLTDDEFAVIEKYIVHAKVNGYVLDKMLGKKTKNFDAFLYISAIPKKIEEMVMGVTSKHTHIGHSNIMFQTFPMVSFSVVRDFVTTDSNFLLIDISGEVTDVSSVNADVISKNVSFPLGRNYIIRKLAKVSKTSTEIALSMLHMYLDKKSDSQTSELIEKVLLVVENEWAVYFDDAFQTIFNSSIPPVKVFITSDSDTVSIFENFLKLRKTDSTSDFRKNAQLIIVNESSLAEFYSSESAIKADEFIILLSLFYSKFKNSNLH